MKDLNRNEVYSLDGITHEEAEELLKKLQSTERGLDEYDSNIFIERRYLRFTYNSWGYGDSPFIYTTTHISTLFEEPSYAVQLIEAVKRLEILKEKVKELKEPKVGDVCMFHDGNIYPYVIGILTAITKDGDYVYYEVNEGSIYENATKLTQQEVIELLYGAN